MNKFARVLFSKSARLAAVATGAMLSASAYAQTAATGFDAALDSVDLTGLAVKIIAAGVLIVAIAIAFKGPTLGKRVVNKV